MRNRLSGLFTNLVVFALGFLSLLSPFIIPQASDSSATFPTIISLMIVLCLLVVFYEIQISILDSKIIAFLGVLIAINAGLRFLENAVPGPAGFSPTFFLIILTGYYFGSRIGFLMGAMTMLVSGLITGGVGPWLPGQMITAGWVGQSASLIGSLNKTLSWREKPIEIIILALFSAFWGMLYGAIMNLWFWPFIGTAPDQSWSQSAGLWQNIQRYTAYYLATSFVWDITRSVGNVLMMSLLTRTVLTIFMRFKRRFNFRYESEPK
jgi:energy-coupling factor transport system substrate-specific component